MLRDCVVLLRCAITHCLPVYLSTCLTCLTCLPVYGVDPSTCLLDGPAITPFPLVVIYWTIAWWSGYQGVSCCNHKPSFIKFTDPSRCMPASFLK